MVRVACGQGVNCGCNKNAKQIKKWLFNYFGFFDSIYLLTN